MGRYDLSLRAQLHRPLLLRGYTQAREKAHTWHDEDPNYARYPCKNHRACIKAIFLTWRRSHRTWKIRRPFSKNYFNLVRPSKEIVSMFIVYFARRKYKILHRCKMMKNAKSSLNYYRCAKANFKNGNFHDRFHACGKIVENSLGDKSSWWKLVVVV